jgi:hypothetical protein
MPFTLRYNQFIESENSVTKSKIKEHNVYKIESYTYADGTTKTLIGSESALIFVLEVLDGKVSCLKISEVEPKKFFMALRVFFNRSLTEERFNNAKRLSEILLRTNIKMQKIPFRTYNLNGFKKIQEVSFNKEVLKSYY